jgi:hypothetical protein
MVYVASIFMLVLFKNWMQCTGKPAHAVISIKQSPVLKGHLFCPVEENFIWTEPVLRGHLFSKTEFSLAQRWPVNTGLTVILFHVWKCWLKYIIKMSFWQHFYNPIKLQKIAFNTYNYIFILLNTIEIIIMSPKRSLRDILCLLRFLLLFFFLSFFRQKFIRHVSQRLLNGNQWNFTGMLNTMSRCADFFFNFQNGRHCHGNDENGKKLKNTKIIIAGYSPNGNWWILIGATSTSSGTR